MKRITALLLVLFLFAPACALALTGQSYATFDSYYQEDVSFINKYAGRHMLPMVLSKSNSTSGDGRTYYELIGDVLTVNVTVDINSVVETCEIRLTAPAGMSYGDSAYEDFAVSGYHSYAFLMAMVAATDAADRYALVTQVEQGLVDGGGAYVCQTGAYTLTCAQSDGTAVLSFQNNGVATDTPAPDPDATPDPDTTDEPEGEDWAAQVG